MRFGLIGTGVWAQRVHAPALAAHTDVEFVGVWGRSVDRARVLGSAHGVDAFEELDVLLEQVDAVALVVSPQAQVELALRAVSAGCHLLLEKPAALEVDEVEKLAAAVAHSDLRALIFLARLFDPAVAEWFEAQRERGWHTGHVTWDSPNFAPGNPFATQWRAEMGPIVDVGPHVFAALQLAMGPITELAVLSRGPASIVVECSHESGAVSEASINMNAPVPATIESYLFADSDGSATAPEWSLDALRSCHNALDGIIVGPAAFPRGAAATLCSLDEGVRTARLLGAARFDSGLQETR